MKTKSPPKPDTSGITGDAKPEEKTKTEEKPKKPSMTSSFLQSVYTGIKNKPPRIVLYGTIGIGKSTWASNAPSPIFIPTEDGQDLIDTSKLPLMKTYAQVESALDSLAVEKHDFKTVVIDSLDHLERLIWRKVADDKGKPTIDDIGFYKGYLYAADEMTKILAKVDRLVKERNMGVVLIAHSQVIRFENPEGESFDRFAPRLHKHTSAIIQEWCDAVLFASYKVYVQSSDETDKAPGKGTGTGERVVRTTERPAWIAKNRFNLPEDLPLDFSALIKAMKGKK